MILQFVPPPSPRRDGSLSCDDVAQALPAWLDGEIDAGEAKEIQQHLRYCPHCREVETRERAALSQLKSALHAACPDRCPSEALAARVGAALRSTRAEMRWEARRTAFGLTSLHAFALRWAPLGVVASLLGVVLFSPRAGSTSTAVVEESVRQHAKNLPIEVRASDADELGRWFSGKLDFGFRAPPVHAHALRLLGARLSHVRDHTAAQFVYEGTGGRRCSLMVYEDPTGVQGVESVRIGPHTAYAGRAKGFNAVYWADGPLVYSMVCNDSVERIVEWLAR